MKKYEYVSLHIGKLFGAELSEHRHIIDEYAARGYSYEFLLPKTSHWELFGESLYTSIVLENFFSCKKFSNFQKYA